MLLVSQLFYLYSLSIPAQLASGRLFNPAARFSDWHHVFETSLQSDPFGQALHGPAAYPATIYLAYKLIASTVLLLGTGIHTSSLITYFSVFAVSSVAISRNLTNLIALHATQKIKSSHRWMATLVLIYSYPYVFSFDRGNIEILAFLAVSLYVNAYLSDKRLANEGRSPWGRIAYLAAGALVKPYVLIFLLIEFCSESPKATWLRLLSAFGVVTALNLISTFILYHGNLAEGIGNTRQAQQSFTEKYLLGEAGSHFFSGPYVLTKYICVNLLGIKPTEFLGIYVLLSGLIVIFVLAKLWQIRKVASIGLVLFTISAILIIFPHLANDYRSIYFILPFLTIGSPAVSCSHPECTPFRLLGKDISLIKVLQSIASSIKRNLGSNASLLVLSGSFLVNKNLFLVNKLPGLQYFPSLDSGWIIASFLACLCLIAALLAIASAREPVT